MLDQESVKAYRSMHLTRDLRQDILTQHADKHAPFRVQSFLRPAAALCSLVLIAGVLITSAFHNRPGAYMGGGRIEADPKPAVMEAVPYTGGVMRVSLFSLSGEENPPKTAEECIPLSLRYGHDVSVSVNGGILLLPGTGEELSYAGTFVEVRNGHTVYWSVNGCREMSPLTAEITDFSGNVIDTITLTYHAADGMWLIANTQSDK